jgi:hypothetical protein
LGRSATANEKEIPQYFQNTAGMCTEKIHTLPKPVCYFEDVNPQKLLLLIKSDYSLSQPIR